MYEFWGKYNESELEFIKRLFGDMVDFYALTYLNKPYRQSFNFLRADQKKRVSSLTGIGPAGELTVFLQSFIWIQFDQLNGSSRTMLVSLLTSWSAQYRVHVEGKPM